MAQIIWCRQGPFIIYAVSWHVIPANVSKIWKCFETIRQLQDSVFNRTDTWTVRRPHLWMVMLIWNSDKIILIMTTLGIWCVPLVNSVTLIQNNHFCYANPLKYISSVSNHACCILTYVIQPHHNMVWYNRTIIQHLANLDRIYTTCLLYHNNYYIIIMQKVWLFNLWNIFKKKQSAK